MPSKPTRAWLVRLAGAAVVLAYFFRFVAPGLRQGFASDDPMNIYTTGATAPAGLAATWFCSSPTTSPHGGLYYLPLYSVFKMNPLPYHLSLLPAAVHTWLAFRFALLLTESELAGGLCAFLVAYHAALYHMVYLTCSFTTFCVSPSTFWRSITT